MYSYFIYLPYCYTFGVTRVLVYTRSIVDEGMDLTGNVEGVESFEVKWEIGFSVTVEERPRRD